MTAVASSDPKVASALSVPLSSDVERPLSQAAKFSFGS